MLGLEIGRAEPEYKRKSKRFENTGRKSQQTIVRLETGIFVP